MRGWRLRRTSIAILILLLLQIQVSADDSAKSVLITNSDELEISFQMEGEDVLAAPGVRRLEFVEREGPATLHARYVGPSDRVYLTFCGLSATGEFSFYSSRNSLKLSGSISLPESTVYPGGVLAVILTDYPVTRESLDPRFYGEFETLMDEDSMQPGETPEQLFEKAALSNSGQLAELLRERSTQSKEERYLTLVRQDAYLSQLLVAAGKLEPLLLLLKRAQERLPSETGIVLYNRTTPGRLEVFLLSCDGEVYHGSVEVAVNEIADLLRETRAASGFQPRFRLSSTALEPVSWDESIVTRLSRLLLPEELGPAIAQCRYLVVVPYGDIGAVPFSCLMAPNSDSPLVDRIAISVAPSLADVISVGDQPDQGFHFSSPLVVGDPETPSADFPRLPYAKLEAEAVAKAFDCDALVGKEATLERVEAAALDADLIHVAAHGQADPTDFRHSSLALAGPEKGFLWTAGRIRFLRLKAKLAVLSACQTGLGQTHKGGILGLFRSFQVAGVPHVVISLWNVNDKSTAYYMVQFYKHLEGHNPAEAVRLASIDTRVRYPDPRNWACFAHFGVPTGRR